MTLKQYQGNSISRRHLEKLPLEDFDSILILADEPNVEELDENKLLGPSRDILHSDSCSLATLLLVRDIQSKRNVKTRGRSRLSIFDDNYTPPQAMLLGQDSLELSDDDGLDVRTPGKPLTGMRKGSVISEITNVSTKPLMKVASVTDYVPSTELVCSSKSISISLIIILLLLLLFYMNR